METGRVRNCKECKDFFKVNREWQIFCSTKCRLRFNKRNNENCFYCGIYTKNLHREHIKPASASCCRKFSVEYIFACRECNVTLGALNFENITNKFDVLISRYITKYKLTTSVIEWGEDEIQELGRSLKQRIINRLSKRRKAEERVLYLKMKVKQIVEDTYE